MELRSPNCLPIFEELIKECWAAEEMINRSLRGSKNKEKIDIPKMNAFINYAVKSWNEWHASKHNDNMVIPEMLIAEKNKHFGL